MRMTSFGWLCILENSVWLTYEYSRSPCPVPSLGAWMADAKLEGATLPSASAAEFAPLASAVAAEFDPLAAGAFAAESLGSAESLGGAESDSNARGAAGRFRDCPIIGRPWTGGTARSRKIATPMTPTFAGRPVRSA